MSMNKEAMQVDQQRSSGLSREETPVAPLCERQQRGSLSEGQDLADRSGQCSDGSSAEIQPAPQACETVPQTREINREVGAGVRLLIPCAPFVMKLGEVAQ